MATPTVPFTSGSQTLTWTAVSIDSTTGAETSASTWSSNYISLYGATSLTIGGYKIFALYDKDKNFVKRVTNIATDNLTDTEFFNFAYFSKMPHKLLP